MVQRVDENLPSQWQDSVNLILGIWLLVSPRGGESCYAAAAPHLTPSPFALKRATGRGDPSRTRGQRLPSPRRRWVPLLAPSPRSSFERGEGRPRHQHHLFSTSTNRAVRHACQRHFDSAANARWRQAQL